MSIDNSRLIHIKQLFLRTGSFANKSDDINLILLAQQLDFIIESFLKLVIFSHPNPSDYLPPQAGYHNKISKLRGETYKQNMDFYRLWDEVIGILRDPVNKVDITDLPLRRDMTRLHEIRNDVQHKGSIPNPKDIHKYIPLVESFLIDTYQNIFDVNFDTLSAISLIKDSEIREKLHNAYDGLNTNDWTKAVSEATIAFHILLHILRKQAHPEQLTQIRRKLGNTQDYDNTGLNFMNWEQKQGIEEIINEIERLREHLIIVGFGFNYSEYVKVKPILPTIKHLWINNNKYHCELELEFSHFDELNNIVWRKYSEEEAQIVVTFVEKQILEFQR